jgi:L-cysteine/cystine lyase
MIRAVSAPSSPDADRLAFVRAALPALEAGIYLNTGSVGPLPDETAAAMAELAEYEVRTGRAHVDYYLETVQRMAEARASVAAVVTADVGDIALSHSTTDGMNVGVWGIEWRSGDRAVTTSLEHPGGIGALYNLRARRGIDVAFVDVSPSRSEDEILEAFDQAIDGRTRAVVVSHVLWASGAVLPIDRLAAMAHARDALLSVDGAQAAGAIPVDLGATGADVYAVAAQKWLLGPEGMGAVAVAPGARERLTPAYGGHYTFESVDSSGLAVWWQDARRYEASNFHRPSIVGMARSIGWLSMFVGLEWIHARGMATARATAERLAAIDGVELVTPLDRMATLITFRIRRWTPDSALEELSARVFAVARTVPLIDALRISVGFFTSEAELDRFLLCVEQLASHTPETLPPRRTLTILSGD